MGCEAAHDSNLNESELPGMSSATACLLLNDPPGSGAWNMAVDEMLLEWSSQSGRAAWRWYAWEEPTVSLGYFQKASDRAQHGPSAGCAWVRRATGGGAIVHDAEWTYSCVLPIQHPAARHRDLLYRAVHEAFIAALGAVGIAAQWARGETAAATAGPQSYVCFQRRSPGDVVVGPHKILGSAQRRTARAVLQHGSLLLRRSPAAPELPGICDLAGGILPLEEVRAGCLQRLARALALDWTPGELTPAMFQRSTYWVGARYGLAAWNVDRSRASQEDAPEFA